MKVNNYFQITNISSELPKLPQSYIPIRKKINVLSQYILKQNDTEPNSNTINDIIKFENHCPNILHIKEADTHLPIRSDFNFSTIKEDSYTFKSDENENAKHDSNASEESENNNFVSFFNESNEKSDTSEVGINLVLNQLVYSLNVTMMISITLLLPYQTYSVIFFC